MKTFLSDIFKKIQKFSEKLDNLTLLTNQHWVSIDSILASKTVYIFRTNNELIISINGKVEKEKWEYLGSRSLLIDKKSESYLFKHGFLDENVLALKIDGSEEYAVFVNENKYDGELNSIDKVLDFLRRKYLDPKIEIMTEHVVIDQPKTKFVQYRTDKGIIEIEPCIHLKGQKAFMNYQPAPDGKYKFGILWYVEIKDGVVIKG